LNRKGRSTNHPLINGRILSTWSKYTEGDMAQSMKIESQTEGGFDRVPQAALRGPAISVKGLSKKFGPQKTLSDVTLDIGEGEMLVVLGPSGSGKTTLLRIIAGLEAADAGEVYLHGGAATHLPPQQRELGVVFQEQALFQRMTAEQNIAFGLKVRKVDCNEIDRTVNELLGLTRLTEHRHKYPSQLSGGQRQRVAIARALAHRPQAMLFDEPFSALDAVTRTLLRREVRSLLRELNVAALFITHDQEEALALADRIAVLHDGRIEQVGTSFDIYNHPQTEFVATFLGAANVLRGRFIDGEVRLGSISLKAATDTLCFADGQAVNVVFRPEDIELTFRSRIPGAFQHLGRALIEDVSYVGPAERLSLRLATRTSQAALHDGPGPRTTTFSPVNQLAREGVTLTATRSKWEAGEMPAAIGDVVSVALKDFRLLAHYAPSM
jgi:ABC-type Fe3+/spermidine/putrescine transport system ATPase subunit